MSLRQQMQVGLLHLTPVLSATASVTYAMSEYFTLIPWLRKDTPSTTLSTWFNDWFRLGLVSVLTFGTVSVAGGYAGWKDTVGGASVLYMYGTFFAIGHFAFVPWISRCIKRLVYGPTDAKDELRWWLKLHTVRMITMDIPAMLCFLGGYLHTM
ncbi:hypothetical protein SERLA73DRAFT_190806 [Serpula lacrymans var. lacrymans S7.3]|uniref:Uncharacterized protein n=2 Tax=Serpula lacrymans var. lacrymans TaxID=341189 RepID=F8QGE6_SERL3|nr:uncharacterized protein SERLADRAFT_459500 [Serpula lacrymans var. lacrymans S7.9]EGN92624.1 hypothetical protein SERLA73DRAFT_190806 [Serpula lacrymans var. lacrymans S7.3]EGO28745.1 hypothetical protein SERLADRAFT_459500 [Serpula lacrymans var. lacrymans S7.9]